MIDIICGRCGGHIFRRRVGRVGGAQAGRKYPSDREVIIHLWTNNVVRPCRPRGRMGRRIRRHVFI